MLQAVGDRVTIVWTPGHSHIYGNEVADQIGEIATKRQSVDIDTGVDVKDSHTVVEKYIDKKWQEQWNMSTKGRHLHKIQSSVSRHIPHHSKNRRQETTAARLRLGICQLNAYLHVIGRHSTGLCRPCRVPETIEHHLIECHNATKYKLQQLCNEANLLFTISGARWPCKRALKMEIACIAV